MQFIVALIRIYMIMVIIRAVFSWLPERHRQNEFYRFLWRATEPALRPIRRLLPSGTGIDFSPLVLIVLLEVATHLLGRV